MPRRAHLSTGSLRLRSAAKGLGPIGTRWRKSSCRLAASSSARPAATIASSAAPLHASESSIVGTR